MFLFYYFSVTTWGYAGLFLKNDLNVPNVLAMVSYSSPSVCRVKWIIVLICFSSYGLDII